MASDSDGRDSSAAILRSIREKLVEYKESLLRQLVDEQEAALTAEKEQEDQENNVTKQEDAPKETQPDVEVKQDAEPPAAETPGVEEEESVVVHEKLVQDEAVLKKRRLEKDGSAAIATEEETPMKKAKTSKAKNICKQEPTVDEVVNDTVQETVTVPHIGENIADSELPPLEPGVLHRVVRTSVPPRKYLMQTRREEEASRREAVLQQQQPVLLAPSSAVSNGVAGAKRTAPTPRSISTSVDQANSIFERRLRDSVRLCGEVNKRRAALTRKRQLPRLPVPARGKSHWDFLLEEMKWMATDFSQERNWKRVVQRHLAADVIVAKNAESVRQEHENRQLARGVALQVSAFWRTMERIAARSRVRFEAAGTETPVAGDGDDAMLGVDKTISEGDSKRSESDVDTTADGVVALKYHAIDVAGSSDVNTKVLKAAKTHMSYIVSAGKRARSAMSSSSETSDDTKWSQRETAFRELQARCTALQAKGGPTIILAAFQLLALRWMLDLYSSGLNIFLNDQLGMGKAATIVAFLGLVEIVNANQLHKNEEGVSEKPTGPHLIVVAEEELHMWRYYLRIWHPDRRIQLYDGMGKAPSYREQLQREWKTKARAHAQKSEDAFLIAPPDDDDEEMEDDECAQPVYCVLCPVGAFANDRDAFVAFANWQIVVVENEHDSHFEDADCVAALQQLRQRQRRILCNGQPVENWKKTALRLQYAEFLVRDECNSALQDNPHRVEEWPPQLLVEGTSVEEVMQLYGKSTSARASLWKSSSQHEGSQKCVNTLLLALSCLSLRRVRSEVEPELGKIEEISLSCQLSASQTTQYRNALSGFGAMLDATGGREERLNVWLQLMLRLREICNCVDIVNDMDKLSHADLRLLTSCSAKLETLEPILRRLALQEGKKVVIYCQFNAMFPILELFLSLLDITYVRVTGSVAMQHRALCHFADRPIVRVALVSTRLSMSRGTRAVSVFGGDTIIVVDSDWNATCDAKLRASWAKMAVGGADTLPVYRLHCENTIEASLLRVGASLTEKVFGEMSPQELLAVPSDISLAIEKPSWWSSSSSGSNGSGLTNTGTIFSLADTAREIEIAEKYCGDSKELERPLIVHNADLDAEEHLLLANTDELTPVEWYAVNYVHAVTDKKQQQSEEGKLVERETENLDDDNESNAFFQSDQRSFEEMAALEADRHWQEGEASSNLFYHLPPHYSGDAMEKMLSTMRMEGMETHFEVYRPPQPSESTAPRLASEPGETTGNQMTFRVSYRVPAPPPVPLAKSKSELAGSTKLGKKQRANSITTSKTGIPGVGVGSAAGMISGVKRKLESQLGGLKSSSHKEQRVDLEGIPVPDVSEFADDDFWGDTNLDALDSAEWDDPALSGILGGATASSTTASSSLAGSAAGASAHADAGHSKAQKGTKKSKTTGRARKSSMSGDSGRDAWSVQDDIVLKKLVELYGANWTLIAQVFNSTTAVSRFFCKKRSPRQCYDRYGKLISGNATTAGASSTAGINAAKDAKSVKAQRAAAAATAQLTPAVLDARIGLPCNELLLSFPLRHSLPGLPPPSIVGSPSLVEMTLKHRKKEEPNVGKKSMLASGGLDDLKSIRGSFDAIIQCMKHKTSPPPIPIPGGAGSDAPAAPAASTAQTEAASTDLGTKASLTASSTAPVATNPTAKAPAANAAPVVVPPPHKSHTDMISLLPAIVLGPDEVIKRSKEAAVVAVQAAAAVASVGRDGSPLSASGDVMLGAGSGFGASVGSSMPRRSHAASLTSEMVGAVNTVTPTAAIPATKLPTASASSPALQPATSPWGANGLGSSTPMSEGEKAETRPERTSPMPVTTSTLLHVLDRMPEIKNKIQAILNRTDCSESQKVAMIARLLSNTNAINSTNAGGTHSTAATPSSTAVLSALTADAAMLSSSGMLIDTEAPLPMPASLAAPSPPSSAGATTTSTLASPGQFQPPTSKS